ncbi:MAG: hypothetical protein WKF95_12290 [Rubrobacter sp.]
MHVRWNRKDFDPDYLVAHLEGSRIPADPATDRDAHFGQDLFFEDTLAVFERALFFSEAVPERDKRVLFGRALFAAANLGELTPGTLIGEVNRRAQEFARRENKEYVLATSFSFAHFATLPESTEISGCQISFGSGLPDNLREGHEEVKERMRRYVFGDYPAIHGFSSYCAVWVSVRGRSEYEAAERALAALDLLRGIWNLTLNRRRWTRMSGQRRRPVNEVLLGPVHSLHYPDGTLAAETGWYEYDYVEPTRSGEPQKRWQLVRRNEGNVRTLLDRSNYRGEIEEAVRRYARALDSREWDSAYVRLWGLLEDLTGTEPGDGHEVTVRRAAFQYADPERRLHAQVLAHLKDYRNGSVHGGEGSDDIEAYLYRLKRYVEDKLVFHLQNSPSFMDMGEVARFFDHPPDQAGIDRKIADLSRNATDIEERVRLARLAHDFRTAPADQDAGGDEGADGTRTEAGNKTEGGSAG